MARFPDVSTAGAAVPASIFARLREHLAKYVASGGDVIPLQIGDTHLPPPARLDEVTWAELSGSDLYAYGSPAGWAPLVGELAAKAHRKNQIPVTADGVQVTCGATHALSCALQALCDPGDELVLFSPFWPLIRGIALGRNLVPVEVAYPRPRATAADVAGALERAITPRTSAIYFATPNNPDGAMLSREQLAAIADIAERHRLWVFADEVYEDYGYDAEHVSIAALPGMLDRTVTVYSFAKSYAQAGLRVGYALASDRVAATIRKVVNHSVYNVPVAMQRAAHGAVTGGEPFLAGARASYRAARDRVLVRLKAPAACPPGGAYLWVDLRPWCGQADCIDVLAAIAEVGVLIAPGNAFGSHPGFARLCFTGVSPERLDEGIDRINGVLGALARVDDARQPAR